MKTLSVILCLAILFVGPVHFAHANSYSFEPELHGWEKLVDAVKRLGAWTMVFAMLVPIIGCVAISKIYNLPENFVANKIFSSRSRYMKWLEFFDSIAER